jgi:hypothetical protein
MQRISPGQRVSQVFLWVAPFLSPILMLVYRAGGLKVYAVGGATLLVLMAGAVWILAAGSVTSPASNRSIALLPGVFLVANLASAAVTVTTGPPPTSDAVWVAIRTEQHVRYVGLLIAGLLALAGFTLLTASLREAGERVFSVLAFSSTAIATVLFILFALGALTIYDLVAQQRSAGNTPAWSSPLLILIFSWIELYAVLSYLATSLYAVALGKVGLLSKFVCVLFVALGTIAAVLALIAITTPNQTGTLTHGLFIFTIPAVPLILPYLIGVNLVRRAGDPVS